MLLKFGDDFRTACEPIARIWHKGNDPIRHRPIAIIVDLHLPEIHAISLVHCVDFCIEIVIENYVTPTISTLQGFVTSLSRSFIG